MKKSAYAIIGYSRDWIELENNSRDITVCLKHKIGHWKAEIDENIFELEEKQEIDPDESISETLNKQKAIREELYKVSKVVRKQTLENGEIRYSVSDVESLKDFLVYGSYCKKLAMSQLYITGEIGKTTVFFSDIDSVYNQVHDAFEDKINIFETTLSPEALEANGEYKKWLRYLKEIEEQKEAYEKISTREKRAVYNKKLLKNDKYYMEREEIPGIEDFTPLTRPASKNEQTQISSVKPAEKAEKVDVTFEDVIPKDKIDIPNFFSSRVRSTQTTKEVINPEVEAILLKSGIIKNNGITMTTGTSMPENLIIFSERKAREHYKYDTKTQYLGEDYRWGAYLLKKPKMVLSEKAENGDLVYVLDYGMFSVQSGITPTEKYPKGIPSFENNLNRIYGVSRIKPDNSMVQEVVISEVTAKDINRNKEFCTNIFFSEDYLKCARLYNSSFLGSFRKSEEIQSNKNKYSQYEINVNNSSDVRTVNALNLALVPYNRILLSTLFRNPTSSQAIPAMPDETYANATRWSIYCAGTIGELVTDDTLLPEVKDAKNGESLTALYERIASIQSRIIRNVHFGKDNKNKYESSSTTRKSTYDSQDDPVI